MGSITMPAVAADHFDGHKNLTPGQRSASDATLEELLIAARVDLGDHETRVTTLEGLTAGMDQKASVDLCTAGALNAYTAAGAGVGKTLTQNAPAVENIDGVAVVLGDRILVNNVGTATGADRGIYTVTVVGTGAVNQVLTRATDADGATEVSADLFVWVERGATLADHAYVLITNDPIVVDTTALDFQLFSLSAHALSHERTGDLEVDGDHLDINFTPTFYAPSTAPAEAAHVDDLAAHLAGLDDAIGNRDAKQSVRLATAGALNAYTAAGAGVGKTLTQNAPAIENIDGVALVAGNRVLVNDVGTATAADRGIYTVTTVGTGAVAQVLTRAVDADGNAEMTSGIHVRVEEGTVYGGGHFVLSTANPIVVDTTALSFALVDTTTMAADMERAGLFEVDGDHLAVDFTPGNYTPSTAPAEAAHVDDLAAHLCGIDNALGGLDRKQSVRLATAGALGAYTQAGAGPGATLTQNAPAIENIDGVAVVLGDRVLVKDGAAGADNGIYTVTAVGTGAVQQVLTRATDADDAADVTSQMQVRVEEGTVNAGSEFILATANPIVVDTTALVFTLDNTLTHAADHERAGELEIDGDHLDIDLTPFHYTPDITPAEAANVDDLAAHLAGIDNAIGGLGSKQPVRLATAGALGAYTQAGAGHGATLTQNAPAIENIDGTALVVGDRVLVNDLGAAAPADIGIYVVTVVGTGAVQQVLTRAEDFDEDRDVVGGVIVRVQEGTANADTEYVLTTNDPIVVDTTALSFERHGRYALVGDITTVEAGDVDAAGAAETYARGDHEHGVSTAAAVDIGGANAEGAATSLARSDHVHQLAILNRFLAHEGIATAAGNAAAAGARNAHRTFDFDDGGAVVDEQIAFEGIVPPHYSGEDLTVVLYWVAAAAIVGDVKWDVSFERIELGALDIDADSYAAAQTVTTTCLGTSGFVAVSTFTFTQAQADAIAANDLFRLLVMRDSNDAADDMVGDAQLLAVEIRQ